MLLADFLPCNQVENIWMWKTTVTSEISFLIQDSLNFMTEIHQAVPIVCLLLGSKSVTDVLEAIDFFVSGFESGVGSCFVGIRKMLSLIWSKEPGVKEAVVDAYKRIYLNPKSANQRSVALKK